MIGTVLLKLRTTLAWVTGRVFLHLLQPTLGTFVVAGPFLASVVGCRPLAERLARDFCPLPRLLLANGLANLTLLLSSTIGLVHRWRRPAPMPDAPQVDPRAFPRRVASRGVNARRPQVRA